MPRATGDLPEAYLRAGNLLLLQTDKYDDKHYSLDKFISQQFIMPAIYCYGHAIELALKYAIFAHLSLESPGSTCEIPNTHNLSTLWQMLVTIEDRTMSHELDKEPDFRTEAARLISEFNSLDAAGTSFRYATNLQVDSASHTEQRLQAVSMTGVRRAAESLVNFVMASADFALDEINRQDSEDD